MTEPAIASANPRPLVRIAVRWALGGLLMTGAVLGGMQLRAQAIAKHDSRAPVDYAADRIELQDRQNRVVLAGNVVISQAGLTVRSARTLVNYSDGDELGIQRITATGGVTVTRGNESARGEVAVYDFGRRIITMTGNVRLNRGGDTLNGARLVIDLASGISSVDGRATGTATPGDPASEKGRVSGRFTVPQD